MGIRSVRPDRFRAAVWSLPVIATDDRLEDTRDFGRYNKAFQQGIGDAVIARTTVEARAVINTKIEMEAIVYKPLPKTQD